MSQTRTRKSSDNILAASKTENVHKGSLLPVIINVVADLAPHGMLPLAFGLSEGGLVGIVPGFPFFCLGISAHSRKRTPTTIAQGRFAK